MLIASLVAATIITLPANGANLSPEEMAKLQAAAAAAARYRAPADRDGVVNTVPMQCQAKPQEVSGPAPEKSAEPIPVADKSQAPKVFEQGGRTLVLNNVRDSSHPLWRPGEDPEEGLYRPVDRTVDGCPVPTPVSLLFAGPNSATPEDAPQNKN